MSKNLSTVFSTTNFHIMAQINDNSNPSEEHTGDELSSEEWMIIGDKESSDNISIDSSKEKNQMDNNTSDNDDDDDDDDDDNDNGEDDEESTAEVVREAIQVLGEQESDRNIGGEESLMPETLVADKILVLKDDDSDGISVITESERNNDSICTCIPKIVTTKDNVMTTPTCIHIVIACLLAVSIGFGIGWYTSLEKPQMPTNDVNFKPVKNGKLLNDINKLNLDDSLVILNSNPELASIMSKHILNEAQKPIMNDGNSDENIIPRDIFKNINISINTLCTIIDNINFKSTGINYRCNHTAFDLMSLKNNIESINILKKLIGEKSNPRFQDNLKSKIDDVSISFVNDLSRSMESTVRKTNQKLNKIKYKLYHKICLMQNVLKNNKNDLDKVKQIQDLGIDCSFVSEKRESNFELKRKGEKREFKKLEKVYSHPVGPDVNQKVNYKNKKMEPKIYLDDEQSNESIVKSQNENKGSKQYKKRKIEKKYYDKNSSEASESKAFDYMNESLEKSMQNIPQMKYSKSQDDWKKYVKKDYENTCHTKPCMNQKNRDRKYSHERNSDNWQFKRSEGRDNWRTEKKVDDESISWDHERSKARESARFKY